MATWLHLAGVHLDIDPEYEVTRDLTSQHPTCVNQKVLRMEVVFSVSWCTERGPVLFSRL